MAVNTHSILLASASSQYLSRADNAALSITGNMTIECWFKLTSDPTTNVYDLVSKADRVSANAYSYAFKIGDSDKLTLAISSDGVGGTEVKKEVTFNPSTATWYHVAVVYTAAAGTADFYVNGVLQGAQQSGLPTSIFDNATAFRIGAESTSGTVDRFFDGRIDEVRIWNTTKTAAQILASYNQNLLGSETNLQGYWKLNNALTDSTSNASTLTNNGSAAFSTDVPFFLDTLTDSITIGESLTLTPTSTISITDSLTIGETASVKFGWATTNKSSAPTWTNPDKT